MLAVMITIIEVLSSRWVFMVAASIFAPRQRRSLPAKPVAELLLAPIGG
jgi:hypothetical protein